MGGSITDRRAHANGPNARCRQGRIDVFALSTIWVSAWTDEIIEIRTRSCYVLKRTRRSKARGQRQPSTAEPRQHSQVGSTARPVA